ncbi:MAG: hypothetical protein U0531_21245 [Dehalococcoidia bacterium]
MRKLVLMLGLGLAFMLWKKFRAGHEADETDDHLWDTPEMHRNPSPQPSGGA